MVTPVLLTFINYRNGCANILNVIVGRIQLTVMKFRTFRAKDFCASFLFIPMYDSLCARRSDQVLMPLRAK